MSSITGASILNEALACIGQRIISILTQPVHKDKNYIASLHNEVVGFMFINAKEHIVNQGFNLACCGLDYWPSGITRSLPLRSRACQDRLLQFLGRNIRRTRHRPVSAGRA